MNDPRIAELEQLAQEEGIRLPYPTNVIAAYKSQGYVVDLESGIIYNTVTVALRPSAQAVAYLLSATN